MDENNNTDKLVIDDTVYETRLTKKFLARKKYVPQDPDKIYAFIPGTIRDIFIQPGQQVSQGDPLLILEAMKMKNEIQASRNGIIKAVLAVKDQRVAKNELLLEFE